MMYKFPKAFLITLLMVKGCFAAQEDMSFDGTLEEFDRFVSIACNGIPERKFEYFLQCIFSCPDYFDRSIKIDVFKAALLKVCKNGNAKDVELLLNSCRSNKDITTSKRINANTIINELGHNRTALMTACFYNNLAVVRSLLDAGADVNAVDYYYRHTALMIAEERNYTDIVRLLNGEHGEEPPEDDLT